jgi:transglutaminase-like putative cysteine protease
MSYRQGEIHCPDNTFSLECSSDTVHRYSSFPTKTSGQFTNCRATEQVLVYTIVSSENPSYAFVSKRTSIHNNVVARIYRSHKNPITVNLTSNSAPHRVRTHDPDTQSQVQRERDFGRGYSETLFAIEIISPSLCS